MSVVVHEVAHGYVAFRFGDNTAYFAKRLTLNPLKHLDPFGSVILPVILALSGTGLVFGWAKPVPYNPNNLFPRRAGEIWVAAAGIIANISLAVIFSILIRMGMFLDLQFNAFYFISSIIVLINIVLAVFNLVPIPPLDGSKILFNLFPSKTLGIARFFEKYSIILLLVFIFFLWNYLSPVIFWLFKVMTGISF